ncbi:MAG: hypothetical protein KF832_19305 [Caldilineaceae bacterium]|nr:hypothetical protein [Caldilineaceae bacterium]
MSQSIPADLNALWGSERTRQNEAYAAIMAATEQPVAWAYDVWEQAVAHLAHADNHNRAIAAQLLCNLAKSDPEERLLADFDKLLMVTKDERFVTARHALQAIWKVGVAGAAQREQLLAALEKRYFECLPEKNWSLIRFDIIAGLRHLYDAVGDETVMAQALTWIEREADAKYRKKYAAVWKSAQ